MSEPTKRCPLCGSDWQWNWSGYPGGLVYARCSGDDCGCAVYGTTQRQVIDRINRRTCGPATAKLIRCIKADLEPTDKMIDAFVAEHEPA